MKKSTEGGQFTKVEFTEYDDLIEGLEALAGHPFPTTIKKISEIRKTAKRILADHREPTEPKLSYTRPDGVEMHGFLDNYIKSRYPGDTRKGQIIKLSAQVIVTAHRLDKAKDNNDIDYTIELSFKLGQLAAFARVYQIQSGASSAKKPSRRKKWAEKLAEDYCNETNEHIRHDLLSEDCDLKIISDDGGEYYVATFAEAQKITAENKGTKTTDSIAWSTFRDEYLPPARAKQEKK
ncbi:MAG: hypothetical protein ACLFV2_06555 [Desulfurivibrionaceae bacterium]